MTALTDLFNGSPGCDLTASGSVAAHAELWQHPDHSGIDRWRAGIRRRRGEPVQRLHAQAPAIGSGNGATALEAAATGSPTQHHLYARASSHKGNSTDNDVAYAIGRRLLDDLQRGRWREDRPGQGAQHLDHQPEGHLARHAVLHGHERRSTR